MIQLPILLAFVLILIIGLSFLSLDRTTTSAEKDTSRSKMSIALVNEDEGADFDGELLDFGNAFVDGLNNYDEHEWFVVSRGTAESGLEDNTYDLMIVIPQDFTQKALSIHSENPEQVVLNYRINATDNETVRAQAEETASDILNDFNRRIIDVYFASILGNLQEAQDQVTQLVSEYENLAYTYHEQVNNPLSGYTNRFGQIQNNTAFSKDTFTGFENTLNTYEDLLVNQFDSFDDYQSNIAQVQEAQENNQAINEQLNSQLVDLQEDILSENVSNNLQELRSANDYINAQFVVQEAEEQDPQENIDYLAELIEKSLGAKLEELKANEFDPNETTDQIIADLESVITNAFDNNDDLSVLLAGQQENVEERIEKQIRNLPEVDLEGLEHTGLSEELKTEIKNVLKVADKYKEEFNKDLNYENEAVTLPSQIDQLERKLNDEGVTLTDTVVLPETEGAYRELRVFGISEGFQVDSLTVNLSKGKGEGKGFTCDNYSESDPCILPEPLNDKQTFTIELKLSLKDEYLDKPINIHDLKQFEWTLYQIDEEDQEHLDSENEGDDNQEDGDVKGLTVVKTNQDEEQKTDESTIQNEQENIETDESKEKQLNNQESTVQEDEQTTDPNETSESSMDDEANYQNESSDSLTEENENDTEDQTTEEDSDGSNGSGDSSGSNQDEVSKDDDGESDVPEPELINIEHHYIQHKVTEPLIEDKEIQTLLASVENTIAPYQKLLSSFEMYFGFSLSCYESDTERCTVIDEESTLKDIFAEDGEKVEDGLITDDSLYAMFNKNVADLLTDYISDEVIKNIRDEIEEPLDEYRALIDGFRDYTEKTLGESDKLAKTIDSTRKEASILEQELNTIFQNVDGWKEQSNQLIDNQSQVIQANNEEQQMVMSLQDGFQPLFSQSQTLAEQASNNLNEADTVYQTLDQIDEQAADVQQSGLSLVQQAEQLANDLTTKLMNDQNFTENFSEVMSNSRIGERQNEALYDFLSNPVEKENDGVILGTSTTTFTPYFIILIAIFVALFTGYGISNLSQKRSGEDQFEEASLVGGNLPITGITAGITAAEGLVLGLTSGFLLEIAGSQLILWTGAMVLIMLAMGLTATYLLRQLKVFGMFILLVVASMYLLLNDSVASSTSAYSGLSEFSPLHHVEHVLNGLVLDNTSYGMVIIGLIILTIVAFVGNLLVVHRKPAGNKKDEDDVA